MKLHTLKPYPGAKRNPSVLGGDLGRDMERRLPRVIKVFWLGRGGKNGLVLKEAKCR